MFTIIILALVTLQRLAELVLSNRNTAKLLKQGGIETGAEHYPLIVLVHTTWLASLYIFAWDRPVNFWFLAIFVILQLARLWILKTLGPRWTTRIIVVPGEKLVASGLYRYLRHPNYAVVICEIACLPMVFGLWQIAVIFSVFNAAILWWRIKTENEALGL